MKTKEQLAENYADDNMEKFDITKSAHLPYYHNDRNKIEQSFLAGFSIGEKNSQNTFHFNLGYKSCEKKIKDKINHLKADLSDVLKVKLTKVINYEKASLLKAQIEILEQMIC